MGASAAATMVAKVGCGLGRFFASSHSRCLHKQNEPWQCKQYAHFVVNALQVVLSGNQHEPVARKCKAQTLQKFTL